MNRSLLKKSGLVLLHSLGFLLLYFVIRKLDFHQLLENLVLFRAWKIAAGLALLMVVYLIKNIRWLTINRAFGLKADYGTLLVFFLFVD